MTPEKLARKFHETYERLAPSFGYETREDTKKFNPESKNGKLMVAVADEMLTHLFGRYKPPVQEDVFHNDEALFAVTKALIDVAKKKNDCPKGGRHLWCTLDTVYHTEICKKCDQIQRGMK